MYRQLFVTPPNPTTRFTDQTVIITGANSGLGLEAAYKVVQLGASRVILACRSTSKGETAAADVRKTTGCSKDRLEVWPLDLGSFDSVKAFARRANELPRLDTLLANAGIATYKFTRTEGHESSITTNVISTALLCLMLHPKLRETAKTQGTKSHITITSSELYREAKFAEAKAPEGQIFATLDDEHKSVIGDRYNVSKLIEYFFVRSIGEVAPLESNNVIFNCVAPGYCVSNLTHEIDGGAAIRIMQKLMGRTTEVGARTLVTAASAGPATHGKIVIDNWVPKDKGMVKGHQGRVLQDRLWRELRDILEGIEPGVTNI
ncbi:NAD(P)-binding protein [Polyplosphaeria fusca]|uniref:NAD(P)-binding protein n=1 Tax=Polyplosphaeria fusca TaxID=682080 RepID=A0A9P4QXY4_9PLEO|nr:NAD(P)-binding protein [Polyplosphaeria fusca]